MSVPRLWRLQMNHWYGVVNRFHKMNECVPRILAEIATSPWFPSPIEDAAAVERPGSSALAYPDGSMLRGR